jgi:hypothetical protein
MASSSTGAVLAGAAIDAVSSRRNEMVQATLSPETSVAFSTPDSIWNKIINDVICVTSLVLQEHYNQQIIDRVTIVRGFADLSVMYPNIAPYRQRVSVSLWGLCERLRAYGDMTFASQLNSLKDRCRKFDGATLKTENDQDFRRYHATHFRALQGHNA